ncbi:class I SAM-dependent methyltransferase [Gordonia sp. NPDC003425]
MTRWDSTAAPRGADYDRRWEALAAAGENIHGEADLVESLLGIDGGGRVLDAGCGTGRVAIELHARGHDVVGVDADPSMLARAAAKEPRIRWVRADLADLDGRVDETFDLALLAGNVMIFVSPGSEPAVVARCADRLRPGGLLVAGFRVTAERLPLVRYDECARSAGLEFVARWSTWDRAPYTGGDYAVSVHQMPLDAGV